MCEYCEKDKIHKSCNFCGSAKMRISVSKEMTILEVQGDKEKFSLFKRIYCPRFDINYCPMCRQKIKLGGSMRDKKSVTKQKQTLDNKKIEMKEQQAKLTNMKAELVKQEYQDNLKEYMEQRLYDLIYKLKHLNNEDSLSVIEIKTLMSRKNTIGVAPKYNNTELAILFDYYKQFIEKINKVQTYLPTVGDFCSFAGISTSTYKKYKQSDDSEKREIMQMIDDYLADIQLTMAQNGQIKEITTIFRAKAEHGMAEAQAPVVIEHKSEANINEIMKQIEAVNQGKSLKTIELKQNLDGIYEEE